MNCIPSFFNESVPRSTSFPKSIFAVEIARDKGAGDTHVPSNKRDLKREAYWQEIIDRQKQSGKSQSQFCRDEEITDHKFSYWKNALAKRQKAKKLTQLPDNKINIPFVPLTVQDNFDLTNSQNAEQIEICVRHESRGKEEVETETLQVTWWELNPTRQSLTSNRKRVLHKKG
jgi:hypothetical protein